MTQPLEIYNRFLIASNYFRSIRRLSPGSQKVILPVHISQKLHQQTIRLSAPQQNPCVPWSGDKLSIFYLQHLSFTKHRFCQGVGKKSTISLMERQDSKGQLKPCLICQSFIRQAFNCQYSDSAMLIEYLIWLSTELGISMCHLIFMTTQYCIFIPFCK